MMQHRTPSARGRGPNPSRQRFLPLSLLSRGTLIVLLWSAASANALPPMGDSMLLQSMSQADPSSFDDPYLQSMRRIDPYAADDPVAAAADTAAEARDSLPAAHHRPKANHAAVGRTTAITRVLNYSVEPDEIVGSGYAQQLGGRDAPIVNTLDPLALATAVVGAQSPGTGSPAGQDSSPFVAGQCLYYVQEIIIQGLASACR
jgi:hypothetical protein